MMNEEVKKLWIEALRSGKYKQARNALKTEDGYCCLGVLCELYREANNDGVWELFEKTGYHTFTTKAGVSDNLALTSPVMWWAGLKDSNPGIKDGPRYLEGTITQTSLAELNDAGKTFEEIADIIEENL